MTSEIRLQSVRGAAVRQVSVVGELGEEGSMPVAHV